MTSTCSGGKHRHAPNADGKRGKKETKETKEKLRVTHQSDKRMFAKAVNLDRIVRVYLFFPDHFIHDLLKNFLAFERIPIPSGFIPRYWRDVPCSGLSKEGLGNVCQTYFLNIRLIDLYIRMGVSLIAVFASNVK